MAHDCEEAQTKILSELLDVHQTKVDVALISKDIELINIRLEATEEEIRHLKNSIPLLQDAVEEVLEEVTKGFSAKKEDQTDNTKDVKELFFNIGGKISMGIVLISVLMALGIKYQDAVSIVTKIFIPFL